MMSKCTTALACAMMLGACTANYDDPKMRPRIVSQGAVESDVLSAADHLQYGRMALFAKAAEGVYPGSDPFAPADLQRLRVFMELGFGVIEDDCSLYLNGKADRQRDIAVIRDTFGPITALAAGIIGLAATDNTVDSDTLTALGLATTAANEGFTIYEQQYLFGAENVGAVENLIVRALRTDAQTKLQEPAERMSWSMAMLHLRTNQQICDPHQIRELVRGAISTGSLRSRRAPVATNGIADVEEPEELVEETVEEGTPTGVVNVPAG